MYAFTNYSHLYTNIRIYASEKIKQSKLKKIFIINLNAFSKNVLKRGKVNSEFKINKSCYS